MKDSVRRGRWMQTLERLSRDIENDIFIDALDRALNETQLDSCIPRVSHATLFVLPNSTASSRSGPCLRVSPLDDMLEVELIWPSQTDLGPVVMKEMADVESNEFVGRLAQYLQRLSLLH